MRGGLGQVCCVWPWYGWYGPVLHTKLLNILTQQTRPSPSRTTLSDIKVAFRLLERLLRCSAVYTGGDKHEDKHIVYCVTLAANGRVLGGA